jgi:hypothetical protein
MHYELSLFNFFKGDLIKYTLTPRLHLDYLAFLFSGRKHCRKFEVRSFESAARVTKRHKAKQCDVQFRDLNEL